MRNTNQNFAIGTPSDCSLKYQKKRKKSSTNPPVISAAINDFNRYLSDKKRHGVGAIHLKKSKSIDNIPTPSEFNQIVSLHPYDSD